MVDARIGAMRYQAIARQVLVDTSMPELRSAALSERISIALFCVLAFLLLNPFVALFVLSLVGVYRGVPNAAFVPSATVSFALFFFFREYGVEWYSLTSTDDVPTYMYLYETNYSLSFVDIASNFVSAPNGGEILWHLPWWILLRATDASQETFVFLHYLLLFFVLFMALAVLSARYAIALALIYLLLTPVSLDSLAHIWRQQLASSIFLLGLSLDLVRGWRVGRWIILSTPLVHFSFIFFVPIFLVSEFARRSGGFDRKLRFIMALIVLLIAVQLLARSAVFLLDSFGLGRIMAYFEGYETNIVRRFIIIAVYAVPMLVAVYYCRNDAANYLMLVMCFAVFSIVLAMPGANTIYERLLMSVVPLWGIFVFRCIRINLGPIWQVPLLLFAFVSGVFRVRAPALDGQGVGAFLAYGNAFDPLMGVLKMLTTL